VTRATTSSLVDNGSITLTANIVRTITALDTTNANGGADTINGGDGNDAILGGVGGDLISGDAGNDQIVGDDGVFTYSATGVLQSIVTTDFTLGSADTIHGNDGTDWILGGFRWRHDLG